MLLWSYLLRISLSFCWLLALVATPQAAVASEYGQTVENQRAGSTEHLQTLPVASRTSIKQHSLLEIFGGVDQDSSSSTEILSPHQLPPDTLRAVFPHYKETELALEEDPSLEETELLSPHQLSADVLEAVFPPSIEKRSSVATEKPSPIRRQQAADRERNEGLEPLSPHQLPSHELEAVFPSSYNVELAADREVTNEETEVLSPHRLSLEELRTVFPTAENYDAELASKNEDLPTAEDLELSSERLPDEILRSIFSTSESVEDIAPETIASETIASETIASETIASETVASETIEANAVEDNGSPVSDRDSDASEYTVAPHSIPLESLPASGTRFRFNGQTLDHLTDIELQAGYGFGNDANSASGLQGTVALESRIQRSVSKDEVISIEHRGTYLQAETVTQSREVTIQRKIPQTVNGFGIQMSVTGACLFPDTTSQQRCSYTPGISTVEAENILDFREAGKLQDDGRVGEVVTEESLASIEQPGFQRGADGQLIGVDLLFPNSGSRPGNRFSEDIEIDRTEITKTVPSLTLARSRQIVQMNEREAALGLTLRGNTWISEDDNALLSLLLQAGVALLPDVVPQLEGSNQSANPRVNRNLFLATNNARLPKGGSTFYHGGIARADSVELETAPEDLPPASFDSLWIGLSPVTDYDIGFRQTSRSLGKPRPIRTVGTEGRGDDNDLTFASLANDDEFIIQNIHDTYVQIYQSLYETDSETTAIESYKEATTYYPHIRFTGSLTAFDNVLNYYAGAIFEESVNAYLGGDYTVFLPDGLTYEVGGVLYSQADRDYYSQINGKVRKRFQLPKQTAILIESGFNWALDRDDRIGDVEVNSRSSVLYSKIRTQWKRFALEAVGTLDGIIPNSARDSLKLKTDIRITDKVALSGFVTPFSRSSSYARYGASLAWQLSGDNSPALSVGWTHNRYGFGKDASNNEITTSEDSFVLSIQL